MRERAPNARNVTAVLFTFVMSLCLFLAMISLLQVGASVAAADFEIESSPGQNTPVGGNEAAAAVITQVRPISGTRNPVVDANARPGPHTEATSPHETDLTNKTPSLLSLTVLSDFFAYSDFSDTTGLAFVGDATTATNRLRLASESPCCQQGSAWYETKQPVHGGFETTFDFELTGPGNGDGFAFVIHNSPDELITLGGGGCYMGYGGITNALVIEFDTFQNDFYCAEIADADGNHVSIQSGGPGIVLPEHSPTYSLATIPAPVDLRAGVHTVRIVYQPGILRVYLDNTTSPLLTTAVDLAGLLSLDNGTAWVGFTGGTGSVTQNHDILNWSFTTEVTPICGPDISAAGWQTTTPLPLEMSTPFEWAGKELIAYNDRVYLFGGKTATETQRTTIYYSDINPDGTLTAWTSVQPLPQAYIDYTLVRHEDTVYLLTGADGAWDVWYAPLADLDQPGAWQPTTNIPGSRQGFGAAVHNDYLYIAGGDMSGVQNVVQYAPIDPVTGALGAWLDAPDLPAAVVNNTATIANSTLYVFGGGGDIYYAAIASDGSVGAWQTAVNPVPIDAYNFTTFAHDGYLYAVGGLNNLNAEVFYAPINEDGSVGIWTPTTAPLPFNDHREGMWGTIHNCHLYAVGGHYPHSGDNGLYFDTVYVASLTSSIPPANILLVDDDDNVVLDNLPAYSHALDAIGARYDVWDSLTLGDPLSSTLTAYDTVIWFSGGAESGAGPGPEAEDALAAWLDEGNNRLFISSQDYHYARGQTDFMIDYLGVYSVTGDLAYNSVYATGALSQTLSFYPLTYPFTNYSDGLAPDGTAAALFYTEDFGFHTAAIGKDAGHYRSTFWGFPFETIDAFDHGEVMRATLNWLAGEVKYAGPVSPGSFYELYPDTAVVNEDTVTFNATLYDDEGNLVRDRLISLEIENGTRVPVASGLTDSNGNLTLQFMWSEVELVDVYLVDTVYETEFYVGSVNFIIESFARQDVSLAIGPNDEVYGVWQTIDRNNGHTAIHFGFGPEWLSGSELVNDVVAEVYHPDIAVDDAGNAYAAWVDGRDTYCFFIICYYDIYFAYRPAGGSWGAGERVNDVPQPIVGATDWDWSIVGPSIAVDGAGNVYVVWADDRTGSGSSDRQIYFATRSAGGVWGPNERLNDVLDEYDRSHPAIAVDPAGNAHAIWIDGRDGFGLNVYGAMRLAGGAWGANDPVSDGPDSYASATDIAVDAQGNAYASWLNFGQEEAINGDYRPAGGNWGADVQVHSTTMGYLFESAINVNEAGNAFAVWAEERDANANIYLAHRNQNGTWGTDILLTEDPSGSSIPQGDPAVAIDSAGRAHVAWTDESTEVFDIGYIIFEPDIVSAALSQLTADRTTLFADGVDTAVITATIHDIYDIPIINKEVIIQSTGSNVTITQPLPTTDGSGQVQAFVQSATAQTVTVSAFAPEDGVTVSQTVILTFTVGPASPDETSIVISPPELPADGVQTAIVSATVRDAFARPTPLRPVALLLDGAITSEGATDLNGLINFVVPASTVAATITVDLRDTLYDVFLPGGTVAYRPGPVDPDTSQLQSDKNTIVADGADAATLTATLYDSFLNPIAGKTVTIQATGTNLILTQDETMTDGNGRVTATIESTVAQTITVTAVDETDNLTLTQQLVLDFTNGPAVTLQLSGVPTLAQTLAPVSPTVTLFDAFGNQVLNYGGTIQFSSSDAQATLPANYTFVPGIDGGSHTFPGGLVFRTTGTQTLQVTDATLSNTAAVQVTAINSVDNVASTIVFSPTTAVADGATAVTLRITLLDTPGNPVANQPVAVHITPATGVYVNGQPAAGSVALGLSGADGLVTALVTATVPGSKVAAACSGTICLLDTATVLFASDPVDPDTSTLTIASSQTAAADGVATIEVVITARDQFNNLLPGVPTALGTNPAVTVTPVNDVTDDNGRAVYQLRHNQPTAVVITATAGGLLLPDNVTATFLGPDLALAKSGPPAVTAGFPIEYSVTIANEGLLTATAVIVTDTLPAAVILDDISGPFQPVYDAATHTILWEIAALPAGSMEVFTLSGTVRPTATFGANIVNFLSGTLAETDLDLADNQASRSTTVLEPAPDLLITPAAPTLSALRGSTTLLTVIVSNNGTAAATNLEVAPPPHIPWATVTPNTVAELGIGEVFTFTIQATPPPTQAIGYYQDIVWVTSSNHAPKVVQLTIYAHPPLTNLNTLVTNDVGGTVTNALVSFTKNETWVRYVEGVFMGNFPIFYERFTGSNGRTLMNHIETGVYSYQISAPRHLPVSGILTVTETMTEFIAPPLTALPTLVFEPNQASMSVLAGDVGDFTLTVRNTGPGTATNFGVITPNDLPWLSVALPYSVTTLAAGEAMSVKLFLSPPDRDDGITYQRYIQVTADEVEPAVLAATIHITTTNMGYLAFSVLDDIDLPVADARVDVVNQSGRIVVRPDGSQETVYDSYNGTTDADGRVLFPNLPVGEYRYVVRAESYYTQEGLATVSPGAPPAAEQGQAPLNSVKNTARLGLLQTGEEGRANDLDITLEYNPFYATWTVREIQITDTYAFSVEVLYVSDIARPALFVSPEIVCTPRGGGSSIEEEHWFLTNMGPITLTNITLTPSFDDFSFTFSNGSNVIEQLAPGEAIEVPFTVFSPKPIDEQATLGGVRVRSEYLLTNGETKSYTTGNVLTRCSYPGEGSGWTWVWDPQQRKVTGSQTGPTIPTFPSSPPPAAPSEDFGEVALFYLIGDATLERQAFEASLILEGNGVDTIEDINVLVDIRDGSGQIPPNFYFVPTQTASLGTLSPNGSVEGEWTIIPGELGITNTSGMTFEVRAVIDYLLNGQPHQIRTIPRIITVLPQPDLYLNFAHSQPDINGNFVITVSVQNNGFGIARNFNMDLSGLFMDEVRAYEDVDANGRKLIFELTETRIDGQTVTVPEYTFPFGDIQPDEQRSGTWHIAVDASDGEILENPTIYRFAVRCRHLPFRGVEISPLLNCGEYRDVFLIDDHEFFCMVERQRVLGGPINTANGNYAYSQGMPALPTVGEPLAFAWTYNSLNSGAYPGIPATGSALGTGWSHQYDISLDTTNPESILLHTPRGTTLFFNWIKDHYETHPMACATLERDESDGSFTLVSDRQSVYHFDAAGLLQSRDDAQGNTITFAYDGNGRVSQVTEPGSGQFLQFAYDVSDRLATVTDSISRTVQFAYDPSGQLSTIQDTRNLTWTYEYTPLPGGQTVLSHIIDPDGRTVEQTGFDELGRAISQTYGSRSLTIDYTRNHRFVTDGRGLQTVLIYNEQGLLVASNDTQNNLERYVFDLNYNRIWRENNNGVPMRFRQTPAGYETQVSNRLGHTFHFDYDAQNNITYQRDARGLETFITYDAQNNPLTRTNHLGDSMVYTYNAAGQMTSVTDENGHTTRYAYNEFGWQTAITDTLGYATYTEYDRVGRPITVTDLAGKVTVYAYDGADNVVQITVNALPGLPQNYLNEYNLITQYQYDGGGNQILEIDTLGQATRHFYDESSQLVGSILNWSGAITNLAGCSFPPAVPDQDLCLLYTYDEDGNRLTETDALGRTTRLFYDDLYRVSGRIVNWSGAILDTADCVFPPAMPDQDLCTLYAYDAVGNRILETDPLGRQTRSFYNTINQQVGMIANWSGSITNTTQLNDCLSLPATRDTDICTLYAYDELGQVTIMTDTLGRATRTFYDELNRVVATVENWTPALTSPAQCDLSPTNVSDENVCTVYGYDAAGNQTTATNALGQTILTVYDALNQPILTVANWDGSPITAVSDCTFPAHPSDVNNCTATTYDGLGRPLSTQDAMGNLTSYAYDTVGRLVTTTQFLDDGTPVQTRNRYDAVGNMVGQVDPLGQETTIAYDGLYRAITTTSAAGVINTQAYNAAGQVVSSSNGLGHTTHFTYDALNRLLATTDAEGNTTSYEYNAANRTAMIDAAGTRMSYQHDNLDRLVAVIENDTGGLPTANSNIRTQYTFDAIGNQLAVINGRGFTSTDTVYDGLNRPVMSEDALGNQTHFAYDALGNTRMITDGNGQTVHNQYDGLNRLFRTEYVADGQVVSYAYDAASNTVVMTDSIGVTQYAYDDLYRLMQVTHPVTGVVSYAYDVAGNRVQLAYPDGRTVSYTYDVDNRLVTVSDWAGDTTAYTYDAAGRQTTTMLPHNVVAHNTYDAAGRLVRLAYTDGLTGDIQSVYVYALDSLGNRVVATETVALPAGSGGGNGTWMVITPTAVTALPERQREAALAYNSNANEYLIVFRDFRSDNGDILAMRADAQGNPLGTAIAVHSNTAELQREAAVTYSPDADVYLVVWEGNQSGTYNIYGRILGGNGQPQGNDLVIAQHNNRNYRLPDVVYDPVGQSFVVIWQHHNSYNSGSRQDIRARFVAANGSLGAIIDVNTSSAQDFTPALATDGQGNFLAVWRRGQLSAASDIMGQLFTSAGPVGPVLSLASANNTQQLPDVAYEAASDHYLVVWDDQRGGNQAVYAQVVASGGTLMGGNINVGDGAPDTLPAVTAVDGQFLVATEANQDLYLSTINADGSLGERIILSAATNRQTLPALAAAGTTALAAWNSNEGNQRHDVYAAAISREPGSNDPGGTQTIIINYTYDPLQRLTETVYSGDLNATYRYEYDALGNMVAYTDTVESLTTAVVRSFDAANQLLIATGDDGTTSYIYDDVGNLAMIIPPGDNQAQLYEYDQRHLLLGSAQYISGTGILPVASYGYDGNGNRIFQVDYTGTQPLTTTYTNDTTGLSQVLVASSGITHTHMLFGLDLIAQDNGSERRVLLADGLGSVRVEMVGAQVDAAVTFEPFGQVLYQSDGSGTVYGFTGEETDIATGLVYLRARYYSPGLRLFLSRDPFPGFAGRPQSQNGYSYTENNPVNLTDPTGEVVDTFLDLFFLYEDARVLIFDLQTGCGNIAADIGTLILDGVGLVIPFVSGLGRVDDALRGISRVLGRVDNADDAVRLAARYDDVDNVGRAIYHYDDVDDLRRTTTQIDNADDTVVAINRAEDQLGIARYVGDFCSFSTETLVTTDDGLVSIVSLVIGDNVLAYNETTGETEFLPVTTLWVHEDPVIVFLVVAGELVKTTPDHPFYTAAGEWVLAGDLHIGDQIRRAEGSYGTVETIEFVYQPQLMYNLTVAEAHTFFVGEQQWLVHNCRAYANTANAALHQLPQNLREVTVAMSMGADGKPVLAVFGRTAEITDGAVQHLRSRGWNVLDAPTVRTTDFHAERQLYNAGYTEIGISRQAGMCDDCLAFFKDKPNVRVTEYRPE